MSHLRQHDGPLIKVAAANDSLQALLSPYLDVLTFKQILDLLAPAVISRPRPHDLGVISASWYTKMTEALPACIVLCFDWRNYPLLFDDGPTDAKSEALRDAIQSETVKWMTSVHEVVAKHKIPKIVAESLAPKDQKAYVQPTPKILPLIVLSPRQDATESEVDLWFSQKRNIYKHLDFLETLMSKNKNDFTSVFVLCGGAATFKSNIMALKENARSVALEFLKDKEKRYTRLLDQIPALTTFSVLPAHSLPWLTKLTTAIGACPTKNVFAAAILRARWMFKTAFCQELRGNKAEAIHTYTNLLHFLKNDFPVPNQTHPSATRAPIWQKHATRRVTREPPTASGCLSSNTEKVALLAFATLRIFILYEDRLAAVKARSLFFSIKDQLLSLPGDMPELDLLNLFALCQLHRYVASRFAAKTITGDQLLDRDRWTSPAYHLEEAARLLSEVHRIVNREIWKDWLSSCKISDAKKFVPSKYIGRLPVHEGRAFDLSLRGALFLAGSNLEFNLPYPINAASVTPLRLVNSILSIVTQSADTNLQSGKPHLSSLSISVLTGVNVLFEAGLYTAAARFYLLLVLSSEGLTDDLDGFCDPPFGLQLRELSAPSWLTAQPPVNQHSLNLSHRTFTSSRDSHTFRDFYWRAYTQDLQMLHKRTVSSDVPLTQEKAFQPRRCLPAVTDFLIRRAVMALCLACRVPLEEKLRPRYPGSLEDNLTMNVASTPLKKFIDILQRHHLQNRTETAKDSPISKDFSDRIIHWVLGGTGQEGWKHNDFQKAFSCSLAIYFLEALKDLSSVLETGQRRGYNWASGLVGGRRRAEMRAALESAISFLGALRGTELMPLKPQLLLQPLRIFLRGLKEHRVEIQVTLPAELDDLEIVGLSFEWNGIKTKMPLRVDQNILRGEFRASNPNLCLSDQQTLQRLRLHCVDRQKFLGRTFELIRLAPSATPLASSDRVSLYQVWASQRETSWRISLPLSETPYFPLLVCADPNRFEIPFAPDPSDASFTLQLKWLTDPWPHDPPVAKADEPFPLISPILTIRSRTLQILRDGVKRGWPLEWRFSAGSATPVCCSVLQWKSLTETEVSESMLGLETVLAYILEETADLQIDKIEPKVKAPVCHISEQDGKVDITFFVKLSDELITSHQTIFLSIRILDDTSTAQCEPLQCGLPVSISFVSSVDVSSTLTLSSQGYLCEILEATVCCNKTPDGFEAEKIAETVSVWDTIEGTSSQIAALIDLSSCRLYRNSAPLCHVRLIEKDQVIVEWDDFIQTLMTRAPDSDVFTSLCAELTRWILRDTCGIDQEIKECPLIVGLKSRLVSGEEKSVHPTFRCFVRMPWSLLRDLKDAWLRKSSSPGRLASRFLLPWPIFIEAHTSLTPVVMSGEAHHLDFTVFNYTDHVLMLRAEVAWASEADVPISCAPPEAIFCAGVTEKLIALTPNDSIRIPLTLVAVSAGDFKLPRLACTVLNFEAGLPSYPSLLSLMNKTLSEAGWPRQQIFWSTALPVGIVRVLAA